MSERWRSWRAAIAGLSVCAGLWSCGFHPRGSITELTDPGVIYVDASRDVSIAGELRAALRDRAFTIAANRDEADILLRLTAERQSQRIVSVQSTGRVSEYELSHAVSIVIAEGEDGQPPRYNPDQEPNRVDVIREYTYDKRGVLGKEDEAQILRMEMREELVRQIVLRTIASLVPSVSTRTINLPGRNLIAREALQTVGELLG